VNIGAMRQRITVQLPTRTTDAVGQVIESFADNASIWGKVEVVSSDQQEVDRGETTVEVIEVRCRPTNKISNASRLKWRGNPYNIKSVVDVDGRNREFVVRAERVLR